MDQELDFLKVGKARPDEVPWRQPPLAASGVVPKCCFRWIFSGPSYSGKTNLARYTIENFYRREDGRQFFDRIILMSPTAEVDHNWADLEGLERKDRRTELDPDWLESVFRKQSASVKQMGRDKAPMVLFAIDDAVASPKFLNSKQFLRLFISSRHQNISLMFMTQSYVKCPRSCRIQATHVAMFPSKTTEVDRLYDEHCPRELNRQEFHDLVNHATTKREGDEFPFLYIDVAAGPNKFRRNFTEQYTIGS
jgi:hypothetical protein